jgi:molecular chaperone GrpE
MQKDINVDRLEDEDPADRDEAAPTEAAQAEAEDPAELRRQRDDYYDRFLRKSAEFENYRRRTDRERRELAESAAADLLEELLPLVDDLERALEAKAGDESVDAYRRGVGIIHRQLLEVLRKRGVVPLDSVGQPFDPHFHQAVAHEVSPSHAEGTVMQEFRRGYKLGDRLLRPAMVKVAKS